MYFTAPRSYDSFKLDFNSPTLRKIENNYAKYT